MKVVAKYRSDGIDYDSRLLQVLNSIGKVHDYSKTGDIIKVTIEVANQNALQSIGFLNNCISIDGAGVNSNDIYTKDRRTSYSGNTSASSCGYGRTSGYRGC